MLDLSGMNCAWKVTRKEVCEAHWKNFSSTSEIFCAGGVTTVFYSMIFDIVTLQLIDYRSILVELPWSFIAINSTPSGSKWVSF